MKKLFSLLAAVLFAGSMMAAVGNLYYTATFLKGTSANGDNISDYTKTGTYTTNGMSWTIPGNNTNGDYIRIGGKSLDNVDRSITSQAVMGDDIAKLVISHAGISRADVSVPKVTVTVASDADFQNDVVSTVVTAENGDYALAKSTAGTIEILPASGKWNKDSYYKITFTVSNSSSSNGGLDVKSLAFYSYLDASAPSITAEKVNFDLCLTQTGSVEKTAELVVTGANLTNAITYSVNGANTSVTGDLTTTGGILNVKFSANADGEYSDTIILTSGTLTQKVAVEAVVLTTVGNGSKEAPFSAADVVKINNRLPLSEKYWVQGYMVGCAANGGELAASLAATNVALGDAADQTTNCVPVELPSGEIRTALNLVDNAGYVGRQVKVYGQLISYFLFTGVKAISDYELIALPAPAPADRRIIAWGLNSVLSGDNFKFSYNANIAGYEANLVFYSEGAQVGKIAIDAPKAGANEATVAKTELPAGNLTWAVELKAGKVEKFAEFTDASKGIYDFYLPQGIAVNNCTESDYFGNMYITNQNGASDGGTDRTKTQVGGIFGYDLALNELNPTNKGWQHEGMSFANRNELKRISVDQKDGMIYYNSTSAIYKIDPANMTVATNILAGATGITLVNSCYAENGVVYFMDNANITDGGTLKKIDAEGIVSTIIQSTTWANADNAICGDGRGGLWVAQHRAQVDVYAIAAHVNAEGVIDFSVTSNSPAEIKGLFPNTNGNASYRGQLAFNPKENILAIASNKCAAVYQVAFDGETGVPTLTKELFRTKLIGTNLDGFAFDVAGNLYFMSASVERLYAYSIPTEVNEVVIPAKKALVVSSTATAIDNSFVPAKVQKVVVNGQVLIIRDGKTYNMMGQTVK